MTFNERSKASLIGNRVRWRKFYTKPPADTGRARVLAHYAPDLTILEIAKLSRCDRSYVRTVCASAGLPVKPARFRSASELPIEIEPASVPRSDKGIADPKDKVARVSNEKACLRLLKALRRHHPLHSQETAHE